MPWEFTLLDRALRKLILDGATEEIIAEIEHLRGRLDWNQQFLYGQMLSHYGGAGYLYQLAREKPNPKLLVGDYSRKQRFNNDEVQTR